MLAMKRDVSAGEHAYDNERIIACADTECRNVCAGYHDWRMPHPKYPLLVELMEKTKTSPRMDNKSGQVRSGQVRSGQVILFLMENITPPGTRDRTGA